MPLDFNTFNELAEIPRMIPTPRGERSATEIATAAALYGPQYVRVRDDGSVERLVSTPPVPDKVVSLSDLKW